MPFVCSIIARPRAISSSSRGICFSNHKSFDRRSLDCPASVTNIAHHLPLHQSAQEFAKKNSPLCYGSDPPIRKFLWVFLIYMTLWSSTSSLLFSFKYNLYSTENPTHRGTPPYDGVFCLRIDADSGSALGAHRTGSNGNRDLGTSEEELNRGLLYHKY